MEKSNLQYVEPEVSLIKFKKEIGDFHNIRNVWREKGVFLIYESFPVVEFVFTTPKLHPSAIAFSVRIDFTNYDIEPPSLKFICPFTGRILTRQEIPVQFLQVKFPEKMDTNIPIQIQQQDLLQASSPNEIPFFCIPGIKEYHDHPAHTGDAWLLHRKRGEGGLGFILDQLYNHSITCISSYQISYNIGFAQTIQIPKIPTPIK
ncbi:MAG TPA: putative metal-binding protein [Candidatus Methanoperedens sp.]